MVQTGPDALFETGDDAPCKVKADYDTNTCTVFLSPEVPTGALTNGLDRLTLNGTNGLTDAAESARGRNKSDLHVRRRRQECDCGA